MRLSLRLRGATEVDRRLARISDAAHDARPVWDALADKFARGNAAQFASRTGWPPLARPTGRPPLVRTGALRSSLTARPLGYERITADSLELGSGVDYAHFHMTGTSRMPRRSPIAPIGRRDWTGMIRRHITGEGRP